MGIAKDFSKNQKNFLLYQSRLEGEMVRRTILKELERAIVEKETDHRSVYPSLLKRTQI